MTFIAIVAGMFLGGALLSTKSDFGGILIGGCLGYLIHLVLGLRAKLAEMEHDLALLRGQAKKPAQEEEARRPQPAREEAAYRPPQPAMSASQMAAASMAGAESAPPLTPKSPVPPPLRQREASAASTSPAAEPQLPPWLGRLISGENLLVKLGVVILFFGVSFLVKYAAQHGMFPVELRLCAAALGGCVLLVVGWRLREKRAVYAEVIQGGGVGILYLTTFAAMRLYHLVPTAPGFVILALICVLSGFLAVLQNAPAMAFLGSAGGFLAPELAAIGSGSHVVLFSYYAVLNAGIIGIAWFRAWRELNLLGFVCTFVVSAVWGDRFYRPEYFATVEPFLILFFLGYTAVALLFGRREPSGVHGYLDGTLVFGTPIVAFALQAALVRDYRYGLAWSAVSLGAFYLFLARLLFRKGGGEVLRPFSEAFLGFGAVFVTLAIPLAFDGRWTAAAWSVEGAGLVWAGLRQERRLVRGFGYLLLVGSGIAFLTEISLPTGPWPVLNGFYCGSLLVSGASLFASYLLFSNAEKIEEWERWAEPLLFGWGMAWWFTSGLNEIRLHTGAGYADGAYLVFIALSCGACGLLRRRLLWQLLELPAFALLPALFLFTLYLLLTGAAHPAAQAGYLAWPLAFTVWYLLLRPNEERRPALPALAHAAPLWLLVFLLAWEAYYQIVDHDPRLDTWGAAAWGVVPSLLALVIIRRGDSLPWPFSRHYASYLGAGCGLVAVALWVWAVCANMTLAGDPYPLRYLPVLNPLDGATLLVLVTVAAWYLKAPEVLPSLSQLLPHRELRLAYGATVFLWLNAALLRTIHHWTGVPFTRYALFSSVLVQAALSVLWGVTSLAVMTVATRRALRPLWIAGAALLGTVVMKLFVIDLANRGSIERIVSFVAVGILLLVIGWFSPVPPRDREGGSL